VFWNGSAWAPGSQQVSIGGQAGQTGQGTNGVAIGYQAATSNQGLGSVAIGYQAGFTGQNAYSVAIGYQAGFTGHGTGSIAIGYQAGYQDSIGPNSIAIGTQAGQYGLGSNSIAIGYLAGPTGATFSNNIILNASGTGLSPNTGSAFYAAPIRNTVGSSTTAMDTSNVLFYNTSTNEITYGTKSLTNNIQTEQFMVAGGAGTNTLSHTYDGINWIADGSSVFTTQVNGVAWNGSLWVAVGSGTNTLAYSSDGINWTGLSPFSTQGNAVAWNGSLWVAVGLGSAAQSIITSPDGKTWTNRGAATGAFGGTTPQGFGVASNGSIWIAVGGAATSPTNTVVYSTDGVTWTGLGASITSGNGRGVAWNGTRWVVIDANGRRSYSTTGITAWTTNDAGIFTTGGGGVAWNGSLWVAVGGNSSSNTIATSPDGITWTGLGRPVFSTIGNGVAWNGSLWVATGTGGNTIAYSLDGTNWVGSGTSMFTTGYAVASRRILPFIGDQLIPITVRTVNQALAIGGGAGTQVQGASAIAIGTQAGWWTQGANSVAIGYQAGFTGQNANAIAIGYQAGFTGHGTGSIAIGYQAGYADAPGPNSIAIGTQAGLYGLGSNSIAIGNLAGPTGVNFNNNIILNASGTGVSPNTGSAFYTNPIRDATSGGTQLADISNTLFYNPSTYEITYAPSTANTLAWTAYTPTFDSTPGATNFGTGGSITGTYKTIGKTVFFNIRMVIGTSPSFGTGVFRIGLPVTAINSNAVVADATYLDNGTNWYFGVANSEYSGSASTVTALYTTGTVLSGAAAAAAVDATRPFTWGATDTMTISGTYQSA